MPPKKRRAFDNRSQRDGRTKELTANRVLEHRRRQQSQEVDIDNGNVTDDDRPPPLQDLDLELENGNRYQNKTKKRQNRRKTDKKNIALIDLNNTNFVPDLHSCGTLSIVCNFCDALRWAPEPSSFCCQSCKVKLTNPRPPPPNLIKFYNANHTGQSHFLNNVRSYNNALALASIGCEEITVAGFNPTFTIQGKLCHRLGALLPPPNDQPKFAQLYFYDSDRSSELNSRLEHNDALSREVLEEFQASLHDVNSYVQSFKSAIELQSTHEVDIVLHASKRTTPTSAHARTYNLPAAAEVAAILPGEGAGNLDIILRCRQNDGQQLVRIHTCHRSYDPLHYVVMFPYGCDG